MTAENQKPGLWLRGLLTAGLYAVAVGALIALSMS